MQERVALVKILPMLDEGMAKALGDVVDVEKAIVIRKDRVQPVEECEKGSRTSIQLVSTPHVDRAGDIMNPLGCRLNEFKLAPTVFWGHNYNLPIGTDEWIQKIDGVKGGIKSKARYGTTGFANDIFTLKQDGILKTHSVGFITLESIYLDEEKEWNKIVEKLKERWGVDDKFFVGAQRYVDKWLLIEHSDVGIAMQPNALQEAIAKGEVEISEETLKHLGVTLLDTKVSVTFQDVPTESEKATGTCDVDENPVETTAGETAKASESECVKPVQRIGMVERVQKNIAPEDVQKAVRDGVRKEIDRYQGKA